VGALVGDSAMLLGEIGSKLPWFSQKLAEPLGRWAAYAQTRAAAVYASGRWLSGIAGMVLGGLTIYEGRVSPSSIKHTVLGSVSAVHCQ